jgi:hypothetical protein
MRISKVAILATALIAVRAPAPVEFGFYLGSRRPRSSRPPSATRPADSRDPRAGRQASHGPPSDHADGSACGYERFRSGPPRSRREPRSWRATQTSLLRPLQRSPQKPRLRARRKSGRTQRLAHERDRARSTCSPPRRRRGVRGDARSRTSRRSLARRPGDRRRSPLRRPPKALEAIGLAVAYVLLAQLTQSLWD